MEDNFDLIVNCNDDDVFSFNSSMSKAGKVRLALKQIFRNVIAKIIFESLPSQGLEIHPGYDKFDKCLTYWKWFDEGIDCEVLKVGAKGWQKGKLRIKATLEFIPDEPEIPQPESPLDDLRQMLNQDNQQ